MSFIITSLCMIINYLDDYMVYLPFWPRQKALAVAAVEMPVEAAFGHQLVDKQEAVATTVEPAQELHEIAMLQAADDPHLRLELLPPLRRRLRREHLDGHWALFTRDGKLAPVDAPEASTTELAILGEVVGGGGQVAVRIPTGAAGSHSSLELGPAAVVLFLVIVVVVAGSI